MNERWYILFPVVREALVEKVEIGRNILVEGAAAGEGFASDGVEGDIERLGVGPELMALQVAPFGTHGAQRLLLALSIGDYHRLCQRRLVIHVERDEHVVVFQFVGHAGIRPNGGFHLTAVHATETREVDEDGFALRTGSGHTCFVILILCLDDCRVEVEILGADGGREGTDGLTGGSPEAGNHIDGEGQRHQSAHDANNGHGAGAIDH